MKNIYFKSNNQEYYLDPNTNQIYPKAFENQEIHEDLRPVKLQYINDKEINKRHTNQLTLILTENCNIRCSYCSFSGQYDNMREHSSSVMDFATAKKAVDLYLQKYQHDSLYSHELKPKIGFFGGEPLLQFDLLKEIVQYIADNYDFPVLYSITTNGILLSRDKLNYMLENDFTICLSINGDQQNNDRLRSFSDGTGTYNQLRKLLELINTYPDVKIKNIMLICIIDTGSDLLALNDFFDSDLVKHIKLARVNGVGNDFTDWYEQYTDKDISKYREQFEILFNDFKFRLKNKIAPTNFQLSYFNGFVLPVAIRIRSKDFYLDNYFLHGSPCIPGDKYAVNPKGEVLMCERVNYSGKIGDVNTGISHDLITKHIDRYNLASEKCVYCPYRSLCTCCFANVLDADGNVVIYDQKRCELEMRNIKLALRVYLEIIAVKPDYDFEIYKEDYA